MEELLALVSQISRLDHKDLKLAKEFYQKFGEQTFNNDEEKYLFDYILPKLYILYDKTFIHKDILYLSLLANDNLDTLLKCLKYDKRTFKLKINDPHSLYDYCLHKNQHWFNYVLNNFTAESVTENFKGNVYNKILLLKLIQITNSFEIDHDCINNLLKNIDCDNLDQFWQIYVREIRHILNLVEFCQRLCLNSDYLEIFQYILQNSALNTFSKYLDLQKLDWNEISSKINEEESLRLNKTSEQSQNFNAFTVVASVIKLIALDSYVNVNELTEQVKDKILTIENKSLQIELLENIFITIFAKWDYFLAKNKTGYICKEKEIRLILYMLKTIFDEIKLNNIYEKGSLEYGRFMNLNKYVADANWRLEVIENVKSSKKCEMNLLKYMLAPPESLIHMCLKRNIFERAYQVTEIFSLNDDVMTSEIKYTEKLRDLKDSLKKTFKMRAIKKGNPNISVNNMNLSVSKPIEDFFKHNPAVINTQIENTIESLSQKHNHLTHLKASNETFMNMFDLAITQPKNYDDCEAMLQLAFENNTLDNNVNSTYSKFCKKLLKMCNEIGQSKNTTAGDILLSPTYLDVELYRKEEDFYKNLADMFDEFNSSLKPNEPGVLNSNHPSHGILLKLNKICNEYVEWSSGTVDNSCKYLWKLYNYLKAFSGVLYIESNSSDIVSDGKNTPYFSLMYQNRSELMGKLLFERNLDPSEFERYFAKLKLDFLYHLIGNCFPTINLHTKENVTKEELYPENNLYIPNKAIIIYIQKRNWLLAFILNEMYQVEDVTIDLAKVRVQSFLNYLNLSKINNLKVIFDNNEIVTALQNEINSQKVADYFESQITKYDALMSSNQSHNSNDSLETGEEILEDAIKSTNWNALLDIIQSIPENQLKKNSAFADLKDTVLVNLIQDGFEMDSFRYVRLISDRDLRISTILGNIQRWPNEMSSNIIKSEVTRCDALQDGKITELKVWLEQIELCAEVMSILQLSNWSKAYEMCLSEPNLIISKLILCDKISVLLKFIDVHKPNDDLLEIIDVHYFVNVFDISISYEEIKTLLDHLPYEHSVTICYNLLKLLRKLGDLQFVVDYLLTNVNDSVLKNVEISLKLLTAFAENEQDQLLCLIHQPLSIIEILIMNTKLDKLSTVLNVLQNEVSRATDFSNDLVCVEKIDDMLRNYAEKSLDFRVVTDPNPRLLRTPEFKLMQSLDSLNIGLGGRCFVMPKDVPSKDEWVPNTEVVECMCCQQVAFSMFNRRHHCRRCGRVVCYNCSRHRMLVPTYGDILVRVCLECYHQTTGDGSTSEFTDTLSTKSLSYDYWLLTDDPEHNQIVRDEFSYEHAPSVSLCLSIMKYHSKTVEYPKFLLDQCNKMLKLLQPSQEPTQEIDYFLVIKMLKSLAIAAKMSSVDCSLQYGTSLAEQILSQAELLGLLADRGCLTLLPASGSHSHGPYIDSSILRRLRDRLLEKEQWKLALEVSTKAGLDNAGVFTAWGKSCLKAGSLAMARDKFQRCLDKTGHYDNVSEHSVASDLDESDTVNRSRYVSKMSNLSALSESKPLKNPPLLDEIVYILESNTRTIDKELLKDLDEKKMSESTLSLNYGFSSQPDAAFLILNKLRNLSNIASGKYYESADLDKTFGSRPGIDDVFYDECVYYLSKYGTNLSLLEFFIKHGRVDQALNYIVDNQLGSDVFVDVYMRCLKDGIVNVLQENMSEIDSTLDVWKDYLRHICRHLEKQGMLNSLYQLQQFMGDYIRAAMTCTRFYQERIKNFTDLSSNVHYLNKAKEHLKQVRKQEQWVEVSTVRNASSTSSKENFEEKEVTNPSLVMKINPKDIDKHVNTIRLQNDVVQFLAECECFDVKPMQILIEMMPIEETAKPREIPPIPTLFGSNFEKTNLAVLAIVCGRNVEDGFGMSQRIIQDLKLRPVKVYCEAGKQLAKAQNYTGIAQLVNCIKSLGTADSAVTDMCDEMLTLAVATFIKANVTGTKVEDLIKLISDRATKISAYIEAKQLKTAYFLAVKYKRMSDIRRILREAEMLNQPNIKVLCQKVLQAHSHTPGQSKD